MNSKEQTAWVTPEWLQRAHTALAKTVDTNAELKRQMVEFLLDSGLWNKDEATWDNSVNRFSACINPARPQYFKFVELWALMKRFEIYDLYYAMSDDLGFEVRLKSTPERIFEELRRITAASEQSATLAALALQVLETAGKGGPTLRVHPSIRDGSASFSMGAESTELPPTDWSF